MKDTMPSLKVNAVLNSILTIMSTIFPLITYPYITRILQVEYLGKVNFASSTISYFLLIASLGITSYAAREGVQYRSDRQKLNQFCSELFTLNTITSFMALCLLIFCCIVIPKFHSYKGLLAIYSLTIIFGALGLSWLYTLEEDYLYITIKSITIQIISLILLFVFIKKPEDYYKYAALNVFANVGGNVFNFFYCKKYIKLRLCFEWKKVFCHIKSCAVFFSTSIASSIYGNIDMTMLGFFCTDYHVGIYSAAVKIYTMIKTMLTAITSVMVPRLTYYKTHSMEKEFNILVSQVFKLLITFLLPIIVGINLVSKEITIVLCGSAFAEAGIALNILSFSIFFAMFATVINGCILLPCKKEKLALKTTIYAALVNLITNLFAIPLFQQNGAAITTVLSEMIVMLVAWRYARYLVKLENMRKTILTSVIGCVVIIVLSLGIEYVFSNIILLLILKIIICAISYLALLYVMKNEIVLTLMRQVLERIKIK